MDRRKSIKALMIGTVGAGVLVEACTSADKKNIAASANASLDDRMQEEKAYIAKIEKRTQVFH